MKYLMLNRRTRRAIGKTTTAQLVRSMLRRVVLLDSLVVDPATLAVGARHERHPPIIVVVA